MEALIPPPQEKDLPAPNEKLLRPPTFGEKYGKAAKWLILILIIFIIPLSINLLLQSQKSTTIPVQPTPFPISTSPSLNQIEISPDKKSILNSKTKETIFTIEDTKNYLKNSGYEYNPDTFQTSNSKYAGDCFNDVALSNKKDKIVFSTRCLPGDLPQPWIGVYNITNLPPNAGAYPNPAVHIKFLIGGSGRNFVWSPDDATITYEAGLGLSGQTETRTIDSTTGKILETKK